MFTNVLLLVLICLAGGMNLQIYYAFTLPENQRREAFKSLTDEQLTILKQQMTAEHYFKLLPSIQEPPQKTRKGK